MWIIIGVVAGVAFGYFADNYTGGICVGLVVGVTVQYILAKNQEAKKQNRHKQ